MPPLALPPTRSAPGGPGGPPPDAGGPRRVRGGGPVRRAGAGRPAGLRAHRGDGAGRGGDLRPAGRAAPGPRAGRRAGQGAPPGGAPGPARRAAWRCSPAAPATTRPGCGRCGPPSTGATPCSTRPSGRSSGRLGVFAGGCTLEAAEAVVRRAGRRRRPETSWAAWPRWWTRACCARGAGRRGRRGRGRPERRGRALRRGPLRDAGDGPRVRPGAPRGERRGGGRPAGATPQSSWRWPTGGAGAARARGRRPGSTAWRRSTTTCARPSAGGPIGRRAVPRRRGRGAAATAALAPAGALWRFWLVRGHVGEGRARLAVALALPAPAPAAWPADEHAAAAPRRPSAQPTWRGRRATRTRRAPASGSAWPCGAGPATRTARPGPCTCSETSTSSGATPGGAAPPGGERRGCSGAWAGGRGWRGRSCRSGSLTASRAARPRPRRVRREPGPLRRPRRAARRGRRPGHPRHAGGGRRRRRRRPAAPPGEPRAAAGAGARSELAWTVEWCAGLAAAAGQAAPAVRLAGAGPPCARPGARPGPRRSGGRPWSASWPAPAGP